MLSLTITKAIWRILLLPLLLSNAMQSQSLNKEVSTKINVKGQNNIYELLFVVTNNTILNYSLRFKANIIVKEKGALEGENIDQEELFVLEPSAQKTVARMVIKAEPQQRVVAFMLIYNEDQIISKNRVVINGFDGEDQLRPLVLQEEVLGTSKISNADPVMLKGMVTEDTKTKAGRDFYKGYYSQYLFNNINGSKVIRVTEELAIGGNTQIKIYAGEDLIIQFFVNPRSSYLENMVELSIYRTIQYFRLYEERRNQRERY